MGRNTFYENLQSCAWTKNATDVILSQNICHDIGYGGFGDGQGLGGQYDPRYVWFLANKVYNTKAGIKMSGPSNGGGGPWYAIGNLIYNVYADGSCNNYNIGALSYRNDGGFTALFNTAYNVDMFLAAPAGGTLTARGNIFSTKQGSCPATDVGITFTHSFNLWASSGYIPGSESGSQVEAAASTFTNPGTDFSLKSASLAINNANSTEETAFASYQSRYGVNIRKDFFGNSRPSLATDWDLGAYEYTSENGMSPPRSVRIINAN